MQRLKLFMYDIYAEAWTHGVAGHYVYIVGRDMLLFERNDEQQLPDARCGRYAQYVRKRVNLRIVQAAFEISILSERGTRVGDCGYAGRSMRHSERGASMVEFAFAATAFLLVLFGVIEFGRALYMYHTVENAARLGSRWAMVRGSTSCSDAKPVANCNASPTDIQTFVRSNVPIVDSGTLNIASAWSSSIFPAASCPAPPSPGPGTLTAGSNAAGHLVCVTVTYPFKFAIPFVSKATWNLSSTSQMTVTH